MSTSGEFIQGIQLEQQQCVMIGTATYEQWEQAAGWFIQWQKNVNWWIGDLAVMADKRLKPALRETIWPEGTSPDLVARCKAVSVAYPPNTRNPLATWTIHMRHANAPNRVALVQAAVDAGQTSDENRAAPAVPAEPSPPAMPVAIDRSEAPPAAASASAEAAITVAAPAPEPIAVTERATNRWLLCVDVNGIVSRFFFAGAEQDAASRFVESLVGTVRRLSHKGLTAVVCCMDSPTSVRKELTASWDVPYKSNRKQKADALGYQLNLVQTLLSNRNADVVFVNGWEADDIMASYARQFDGKVSLWTVDKDMRQCLSPHVNILEDVEWERDEATNTMRPLYKWVNQEAHEEKGIVYQSDLVTGIKPERWPLFQAIAGDASDSIQGAKGIGPKGAMELLKNFASLDDILAAARDNHPAIAARQRKILLAWEPIAHDTLQLTTLRTDLTVPAVLQMNLLLEPHSTHSTTAAPPHDSELPQQPSPPDAGYDNWPADDRSE